MTLKKKIGWTAGILLVLVVGICIGGSLYLIDFSLRPENRGKNMAESETFMRTEYSQIVPWLDSLQQHHALRDTFITAPDGIRMHAFYALPDLRYTGLTEGDAIQMGWLDRKDVLQWIDTAPALFGDSLKAVVHGISMGAATTMMVSGEKTPEYITCFVEDCGYTSVWDQFSKELKGLFGLPPFPLLYTASWICQLQNGWNFQEASALSQVARCTKPMLFIHGDNDDFVPTWMVHKVYAAKPSPKEIWITEGVDHAHSYKLYPDEYTEKVKAFTDKYVH